MPSTEEFGKYHGEIIECCADLTKFSLNDWQHISTKCYLSYYFILDNFDIIILDDSHGSGIAYNEYITFKTFTINQVIESRQIDSEISSLSDLELKEWQRNYVGKIPEAIIRRYADRLDWDLLCMTHKFGNKDLTTKTLTDNLDKIDWDVLSRTQELPIFFIRQYRDKINWDEIWDVIYNLPIVKRQKRASYINMVANEYKEYLLYLRKTCTKENGLAMNLSAAICEDLIFIDIKPQLCRCSIGENIKGDRWGALFHGGLDTSYWWQISKFILSEPFMDRHIDEMSGLEIERALKNNIFSEEFLTRHSGKFNSEHWEIIKNGGYQLSDEFKTKHNLWENNFSKDLVISKIPIESTDALWDDEENNAEVEVEIKSISFSLSNGGTFITPEEFCDRLANAEDVTFCDAVSSIPLSESFIRKFKSRLNWTLLTKHSKLSCDFLEENWDIIKKSDCKISTLRNSVMSNISRYQGLTADFIIKHQSELCWSDLYDSYSPITLQNFPLEDPVIPNVYFSVAAWREIIKRDDLSEEFRRRHTPKTVFCECVQIIEELKSLGFECRSIPLDISFVFLPQHFDNFIKQMNDECWRKIVEELSPSKEFCQHFSKYVDPFILKKETMTKSETEEMHEEVSNEETVSKTVSNVTKPLTADELEQLKYVFDDPYNNFNIILNKQTKQYKNSILGFGGKVKSAIDDSIAMECNLQSIKQSIDLATLCDECKIEYICATDLSSKSEIVRNKYFNSKPYIFKFDSTINYNEAKLELLKMIHYANNVKRGTAQYFFNDEGYHVSILRNTTNDIAFEEKLSDFMFKYQVGYRSDKTVNEIINATNTTTTDNKNNEREVMPEVTPEAEVTPEEPSQQTTTIKEGIIQISAKPLITWLYSLSNAPYKIERRCKGECTYSLSTASQEMYEFVTRKIDAIKYNSLLESRVGISWVSLDELMKLDEDLLKFEMLQKGERMEYIGELRPNTRIVILNHPYIYWDINKVDNGRYEIVRYYTITQEEVKEYGVDQSSVIKSCSMLAASEDFDFINDKLKSLEEIKYNGNNYDDVVEQKRVLLAQLDQGLRDRILSMNNKDAPKNIIFLGKEYTEEEFEVAYPHSVEDSEPHYYIDGVEVTEDEFSQPFINALHALHIKRYECPESKLLHNFNGPALISYEEKNIVVKYLISGKEYSEAEYYKLINTPYVINDGLTQMSTLLDGSYHNDVVPAVISDLYKTYYHYGFLHRMDGPAKESLKSLDNEYYLYGYEFEKEDYYKVRDKILQAHKEERRVSIFDEAGLGIGFAWFDKTIRKMGRIGGPAKIYKSGCEEYYLDGKHYSRDDYYQELHERLSKGTLISESQSPAIQMVKSDGEKALYRIAATQITNIIRRTLVNVLEKTKRAEAVSEFLDSTFGHALVGYLTGHMLERAKSSLPTLDQNIDKVCKELRIESMAEAGNEFASGLIDTIMPLLPDLLQAPNMRIALDKEIVNDMMIEDETHTTATLTV